MSANVAGKKNSVRRSRSILKTMNQPFDLTDYDWSPELWIACHDEDEQNSRLANQLWDDNGLDVPETFLQDLLPYLGRF